MKLVTYTVGTCISNRMATVDDLVVVEMVVR
jgi:hypothetical protein